MFPTFHDRDQIFTVQDALIRDRYRRGDVVVFDPPMDYPKKGDFIKRIIGMPGDIIEFKGGQVILNGNILEEEYTSNSVTEQAREGSVTVPEGHVFVMGDNRNPGGSMDSRIFGTVPIDNIHGVVVFRYWPLSRMGKIDRGE